jgi:uncharacterized surface protein with fasciclin (FAS1) repeats
MKKLLAAAFALAVTAPAFAADEPKTVVDAAVANKDFSTLVTALKAADLVETLQGKGPFTVFAPTNEAFEKLGKEKLDNVLKDKELLKKILLAHVVDGKQLMAKDAVAADGKEVNGFKIKVDGKTVMIGEAKVVKTDVKTGNGVIHVIDTVLIPTK